MKSLAERRKQRAHLAKVNSGEINDPVALLGTDENGEVIGTDGKPVPGTAAGGFKSANTEEPQFDLGGGNGNGPQAPDYTKLRTHDALNGENGLAGRPEPEGWANMGVEAKQGWLAANPVAPATVW